MKRPSASLFLLFLIFSFSQAQASDNVSTHPGSPPDGWRERSAGFFVSRPALTLSGNGLRLIGEADLKPGSGMVFETGGERDVRDASFDLAVQADACNLKSLDYEQDDAHFIFSETIVFGHDKQERGFGARIALFFGNLWHGFPPNGIRLTYAWGGRAPVGSMYRITDEETVFVIAGQDEVGKRIESKRSPGADFQAAYGRAPKGPVTGTLIRLDRPSIEKGNARLSFELKLTSPIPGRE